MAREIDTKSRLLIEVMVHHLISYPRETLAEILHNMMWHLEIKSSDSKLEEQIKQDVNLLIELEALRDTKDNLIR